MEYASTYSVSSTTIMQELSKIIECKAFICDFLSLFHMLKKTMTLIYFCKHILFFKYYFTISQNNIFLGGKYTREIVSLQKYEEFYQKFFYTVSVYKFIELLR